MAVLVPSAGAAPEFFVVSVTTKETPAPTGGGTATDTTRSAPIFTSPPALVLLTSEVSATVALASACPMMKYAPAVIVAGIVMSEEAAFDAPPGSAGTARAPRTVSPASSTPLADR